MECLPDGLRQGPANADMPIQYHKNTGERDGTTYRNGSLREFDR
jgi:hypothetical protein